MALLSAPLTAFTAALVITWWLASGRLSFLALDHPNARSLHETPLPRTGGIALLAGVLLALGIIAPDLPPATGVALGVMILISLLDDLHGVPAAWRLLAHLLAAGLFAVYVLPGEQGLVAVAATVIAVAWMANLYNFMDGSDGLAGGMTAIGFFFYGVAAWLAGSTDFAFANFSVAAAAAAFLVFNFHPARIFMGDVGSVPLGFLAAAFGLIGWLQRDWALWYPVLVFSPFVVDASVTLARRLARREKVWEAHRDHYYQRLVQLGWGHRLTALAEYGLMAGCGLLALAALPQTPPVQVALLVLAAAGYAGMIAAIERAWRRKTVNEKAS